MTRRVLAIVADMIFLSKIRETARHVSVELTTARGVDAALAAAAVPPDLVVCDLDDERAGAIDAIVAFKNDTRLRGVPIVGFYPHVAGALRDRAIAAGCDRVMPRSRFASRLAEILGSQDEAFEKSDDQRLD